MTSISMQPAIVKEPSTLVYTLLNAKVIDFDDFYLLVRANHNYMVESVKPFPDDLSVHVRVNFQASVANFHAKLGSIAPYVAVTKLSSLIHENEYARLDQLKRHYGIGTSSGVPSNPAATPLRQFAVPTAPAPVRGKPKTFRQRPAPYKSRVTKKAVESSDAIPIIDLPDTQECDATGYTYTEPEAVQSRFYISDPSDDQEQVCE